LSIYQRAGAINSGGGSRYRLSRLADPEFIKAERTAGGWPVRLIDLAEVEEEYDVPRHAPAPEPATPPTWTELVQLEPRLLDLVREALEAQATSPNYCANAEWYGYRGHQGIKPRLVLLVGDEAAPFAPELLRTSAAYDVAYKTVYEALPDCKHPGPIC
jgi:hypothetical protein